jgi:hypothetical protein
MTLHWTGDLTWEGIAALAALALSIWSLWLAMRAHRRAEIHAAFRSFVQGKQLQTWLVISNRGQATAKDVRVSFRLGGEDWEPQGIRGSFPIPLIAPGHSVPVEVTMTMPDHAKGMALGRFSWRDDRIRRQGYETTVSLSAVPGGGGLTSESVIGDLAFGLRGL